jgi:hypothetical protein
MVAPPHPVDSPKTAVSIAASATAFSALLVFFIGAPFSLLTMHLSNWMLERLGPFFYICPIGNPSSFQPATCSEGAGHDAGQAMFCVLVWSSRPSGVRTDDESLDALGRPPSSSPSRTSSSISHGPAPTGNARGSSEPPAIQRAKADTDVPPMQFGRIAGIPRVWYCPPTS